MMTKIKNLKSKIHTRTWVALILIVILLPIVIYVLYKPSETKAEWFDEAYLYRQKFSFTHNADISDNRAITFTLDTAELIAAGVMQSDCDDTRFTDAHGKLLNYDLTGTCDNAATTYEVIFPSIINGTQVGYVYYGNSSAINAEIDSTVYTALTPSGGDPSAITDRTNEEQSPGPAAYWKFDEGVDNTCSGGTNDACDAMGHGLDGAKTGATWQTEDMCVSGKCLLFDGTNDTISVGDNNNIDFAYNEDFSVSFWVKDFGGSDDSDAVVEKWSGSGGYPYAFRYKASTDSITFNRYDGTNNPALNGTTSINDNKWHHIVGVKDSSTLRIYIDGAQTNTTSDTTTGTTTNSSSLYFGSREGSSQWYNGFIDEVKIYPYARTAAQVKSDYLKDAASIGSSTVLGAQDTAYLNNGLVGYWKMDDAGIDAEGEQITDSSGNGNSGTLYGDNSTGDNGTGMDCTAAGKYGTGCEFDGTDDYISLTTTETFTSGNNYSLSAWVNTSSATTNGILGYWEGNTQFRIQSDGTLRYIDYGDGIDISSTQTLDDGNWHHVALSVENSTGGKTFLAVDGAVETTDDSVPSSASFNTIGASYDSGTYFNGLIDSVRIYNRALSPAEVRQLYNWAPGPVGYWNFDEGSGQVIYDTSGNGINGTLGDNTSAEGDDPSWTQGKYGSGLEFTRSNSTEINISDSSLFDTNFDTGQYTWEFWVKPTGNANYGNLWSYTLGSGRLDIFTNANGGSTCCVYIDFIGGTEFEITTSTSAPATLALNQWSHVAVTYDGNGASNGIMRIYIDGIQVASDTNITELSGSLSPTALTMGDAVQGQALDGVLDEVRYYNYARTPGQVIQDMNAGHPLGGSPIGSQVAYWNLDETYGATAYDTSINENNLTLSSASWTTSGKINAAYAGADNTRLSRLDDADLDFAASEDLSISGWFKRNTISAAEYLVYKENGNEGYTVYLDSDGDVVFGIGDTNSVAFPEESIGGTLSKNYDDNSWHHFVAQKNGTTGIYLYVDGVQIASDTSLAVDATLANSGTFYLGDANATDGTDEFLGTLDEIKIYRGLLSADEIKVDYNAGKAVNFGIGTDDADDIVDGAGDPPVAYYPLDENSGTVTTYDKSGNGLNGALAGITQNDWRSGKYGSSLNFDNINNTVTVTNNDLIDRDVNLASGFTFSTWLYIRSDGNGAGEYGGIFDKGSGTYCENEFEGSTTINIACNIGFDSGDARMTKQTTKNQWHHLAMTYDGNVTLKMWIDGVYQGSDTGSGTMTSDTGNLKIGYQAATNYFDGLLDEFKVFDYALTPAQIAYEYNRGLPVGWWKLDECQGTTAYDASGNGNNGTITIGGTGDYTSAGTCSSGTSTEAWNAGTTGKFNYSLGFDGTNDYVNIYSSGLASAFSGTNGSVTAWAKVSGSGVWSDGQYRWIVNLGVDNDNLITLYKTSGNALAVLYEANNVQSYKAISTTTTDWFLVALTWDTSADEVKMFVNGVQQGATITGLGSWTGSLDSSYAAIGARNTSSNFPWSGLIDEVRVYNYALSANQIKKIMNDGTAARFGPNTGSP